MKKQSEIYNKNNENYRPYCSMEMTGAQQNEPSAAQLVPMHVLEVPPKSIGSGDNILRYSPQSPVWQCAFSRDGVYLAACFGAPEPCIRVWKYVSSDGVPFGKEGKWILQSTLDGVHTRTIRSIAFAPIPSPLVIAAASFDATISIWEYDASNQGSNSTAKDQMGWECTTQLEGHDNEVKCVAWNASGSLLASCGRDKTVWIWECFLPGMIGSTAHNAGDFECLAVLNGHEGDIKCVQFASSHGQWGDGEEICLSCAYDDTIKVWAEDAGDWYCALSIGNVHSDTIWSLTVAPGSGRMVSGSSDGSIAIYKSYTASEKRQIFPEEQNTSSGHWHCVGRLPDAHSAEVYALAYAPSRAGHGRLASGGGDDRIQIYREIMGSSSDEPKFALEAVVETQQGDINSVCWHPWDGSILCSGGDDGTVRLWNFKQS